MQNTIQLEQGEIKIKFNEPVSGKKSLKELGLSNDGLHLEDGRLRLVFDLEGIGEHHYYQVPTLEFAYNEEMSETHWQCDFNGETILDKYDHHGKSTVILLNRNRIAGLEHHHENKLIVHAEFPAPVHLDAENSYINIFN